MDRRLRTIATHTLVPSLVPENGIVVDVGANLGTFSQELEKEFRCRCFAIEPSPQVFERIPTSNSLRKYCLAVAGVPGEVELHIGANPEATTIHKSSSESYVSSISTSALTLQGFCDSAGIEHIDILKMDIEGEELAVLDSCTDDFLRDISQITVEFHEWMGQGTVPEVKAIVKRLNRLGFWSFNVGRTIFVDVLFVNRRHMSRTEYMFAWVHLWLPRFFQSLFRRLSGRRSQFG
jgi:FkbM family methyltransferase